MEIKSYRFARSANTRTCKYREMHPTEFVLLASSFGKLNALTNSSIFWSLLQNSDMLTLKERFLFQFQGSLLLDDKSTIIMVNSMHTSKLIVPLDTVAIFYTIFLYFMCTYCDGCIIRKYVFIIRSHCQPMMLLIIISSDTIKQLAGKRSRPIRVYIILRKCWKA